MVLMKNLAGSDRAGVTLIVIVFFVLCAAFGRDDFTIWFGIIGSALSLIGGTVVFALDKRRAQADDAGY